MSKAKILHNIANALKHNPMQNEKAVYQDIIIPIKQDKLEEYKRLQEFNKAEVFDIKEEEIPQILQEIFQKEKITKTLIPASLKNLPLEIESIVYDQKMEELKEELFEVESGVLSADYGVANLGVVALTSSSDQPRLLSLITKHCIILLKKDKVVSNLSEALGEIKKANPNVLPSNILFVAGPSRTADIELQVVFGVHGPQKVCILLVS